MKKMIFKLLLLILSIALFLYAKDLNSLYLIIGIFFSGLFFGVFLMSFNLNIKDDRLSSFKKELEKESLTSQEASSRVKILESKIKVLEKALENALNK